MKQMKKVKRVLPVLLVAALALGMLAGCDSGNGGTNSGSSEGGSDKTYVIATDTTFAPFEFTNEQNEFVGIDVDILAAVAEDQGFEYDLQPLGFEAACTAVSTGQADGVIAGMSITEDRMKDYDFSESYYESTVCASVAQDSDITDLEGLRGQSVAVKTGTQSAAWAESIKDEYGLTLNYYDDSAMMYQEVKTGNSVACFEDYPVMAYGVSQNNGMRIIAEESEEYATPYGFAVRKGENAELIEMFNAGLANIKANGTFDEIIAKYLGSSDAAGDAADADAAGSAEGTNAAA